MEPKKKVEKEIPSAYFKDNQYELVECDKYRAFDA